MFKNYLKIAWRNLVKNKAFSFINIAGLAIGMASAALILLWVQNEVSYDQFHSKKDRLYKVYNRSVFDGKLHCWASTPKPLASTMRTEYPQVEDAVFISDNNFLFTAGDNKLKADGYFTDSQFLTMFDFPLAEGNAKQALSGIYNIVLTQKMAKRLFGNADAMGKTVRVDSTANFTVTGVLKDLPNNTAFKFDYLVPRAYMHKLGWEDPYWGDNSVTSFVLLKPGVSLASMNAQLKNFTRKHSNGHEDVDVFLYPLDKWRLYNKFENGKPVGGMITYVRMFSIIAAFILLIACINFMNLSTARSEKRAKEVGIRKVAGAGKQLLVGQFLGESVLIALIAGVFAFILVLLSLPAFNQLTSKELAIPYASGGFWLITMFFIVLTGVIAGSYPAFYLSSFKPIKVLKGTFKASNALVTPRKVLVVTQFTFAIVLIICTIVVKHQINYAQNRDIGYKRDNLVFTLMEGEVQKHADAIKNELLSSGAAISVTKTSSPITQSWSDSWGYSWKGKDPDKKLDFNSFTVDDGFTRTLGLKMVEGRDIDVKTYPTDSLALIVNQSAAKVLGFKDPIGQTVKYNNMNWHIVGVVNDFIMESPYQSVAPMMVHGPKGWFNFIHFKLNPANSTAENLKKAEEIFKKYNPDYPVDIKFADEDYGKKFKSEQLIGKLASLFAGLTIFISCLGLFGLATYMAQNRIKEIGIRKVLGASVTSIATLLSTDFLKLVIVSFLIATPIAWYSMSEWLEGYQYRVHLQIWVFLLAAVFTSVIALLTISFQAIKAAVSNPVKSLRSE
ncbi:ABC transporter permease [Mucilaginibacter sp. RS28]|uniref:ABC transporter permease n=1 Tax=Mucilaginibacter straminoryzae TaxID=2932774 RepID=A0A9X1X6W3_9SPHI|nr:ABC transporter permease [Mucilaginibacter straminoryzae]MCJ8211255.1 ABC transporter permease [Mucilaginibacter straminoryzae]